VTGLENRLKETEHSVQLLKLAFSDLGFSLDSLRLAADLNQVATQESSSSWLDWYLVAGPATGLRCRRHTGKAADLAELSQGGAVVLTRQGSTWVALTPHGTRNCGEDGTQRSDRTWQQCLSADAAFDAIVIDGKYPKPAEHQDHLTPWQRLVILLAPERTDIITILIYSVVIAMLTLATPLAVESLVNTVAFGTLIQPIVVLSVILFGFLTFSAVLKSLQSFVAEIIQRRIFARVASDMAWRLPRVDATAVETQNMPELINRFFDVVMVQKVVSAFLLDGIGVLLTTLIGMAVLAFYHPWMLAFDLVLMASILFILTVLAVGAVKTSIKESKFKYSTADELEQIARCPLLFKGLGGAELAVQQVDNQVAGYLDARKKHFRILLRQSFSALMLQALASTALLALGGLLVIRGQLTLGQLIAAELIVTVIVSSVAKFGKQLEAFYDLLASIDKLGYLYDVPVEPCRGAVAIPSGRPIELRIETSAGTSRDVHLVAGQCATLEGDLHRASQLIDYLYGLRPLESGAIQLSGVDLREIRSDLLRRDVAIVRRIEILTGTIADNITLERPHVDNDSMWKAIRDVGLEARLNQLPKGVRCPIAVNFLPLSRTEAIRLCLARALAGNPKLLLIDGLLDSLSDGEIEQLKASDLFRDPNRIVLLQTGRERLGRACSSQITLG
jgi:putative ABC transport system ATP-binding protein